MVDLNATFAISPPSVRRHRKSVERRERIAELKDDWREQNWERKVNDIPRISWADFSRRHTS